MRRFLLVLIAFISVNVFAQKKCSVTYDFTNPLRLTPSITPTSEKGSSVSIDGLGGSRNYTLTEGQININFKHNSTEAVKATGVRIATDLDGSYHLQVGRSAEVFFEAVDKASITRIKFSDNSFRGGIRLNDYQPGVFEYGEWKTTDDGGVNKVSFLNSGSNAKIMQVTVDYITPTDLLEPVSNVKNNDVLPLFKDMTLTFASNMKVVDASKITVKGGGVSEVMKATVANNVVTLSLDAAIQKDGTYTVTVPAKSFEDPDGYQNKELVYVFKVNIPKNTFNFVSLTPAEGRVEQLTDGIVVTFPDIVGHVDNVAKLPITLSKDGEVKLNMIAERSADNSSAVVLKFDNDINTVFTEKGIYTIDVPEKTVYNAFYGKDDERYNAAFTITYYVGVKVPVPDTEVMKAAKELLLVSGVGYPAEQSAARVDLRNLVDAENTPSDEALQAAIDAFYAETDIMLPVADKYYTISNVNAKNDSIYLAYGNGKVSLTADKAKAARFTANVNADRTVVFQTLDGRYLHALVNAQNFDLTTPDNVTAEYNASVNNLMLTKFAAENVDVEKLFGMMSIYGGLGKDKDTNKETSAYVVVRHSDCTVATDAYKYIAPVFTDNVSSAFVVADAELVKLETVELAAELTPAIVAHNTDKLTLKFTSAAPVVYANTKAAYFKNAAGEKVADAVIEVVDGKTKEFNVLLAGLADGSYTLVLPEATFTTEKNGNTVNVAALEKDFTIDIYEAEEFKTSFYFSIYNDKNDYCFDTDLNDFIIYTYKQMYADEEMEVRLYNAWSASDVIRVGHMKKVTLEDIPEAYAYQLVFSEPIKKGELRPNQYTIVLEEALVGDENFAKYLADRTSVRKSQCNVNPRMTFTYNVDNDKATAITDIKADDNGKKEIYTISGRRVKNMNTPGIYIINGKKIVKNN